MQCTVPFALPRSVISQARGSEIHRKGSQEDQGEKLQQRAKQHEQEELKMRNRGVNALVS